MSNSRKYVIIDTDCGIDDAMAIILATNCHRNHLIDILGITCSHGNTSLENVIKNVNLTLRANGLQNEIKVYGGCAHPIIGKHESFPHYSDDGFGGATNELPPLEINEVKVESEHAVNALIRLAKEYPKRITLMLLGPLTNVSVAYLMDNQFFDNLDQIVFMGGTIDCIGNVKPTVEFNIWRDPEALHIMLTNAKCGLTFVPWECGLTNLLTWDDYKTISELSSESAKFIQIILAKDYKRVKSGGSHRKGLIMCDVLAVFAVVFQHLIQSTQRFPTAVELNGNLTKGQLVIDKRTRLSYEELSAPKVTFIENFKENELWKLFIQFLQ